MAGALVADEMGLCKMVALVAVAMTCNLLTVKVVVGFPLSILCGNTLEEWVNMAQNDCHGIIDEEWEYYPLQRLN